jgi:hypothetical protein
LMATSLSGGCLTGYAYRQKVVGVFVRFSLAPASVEARIETCRRQGHRTHDDIIFNSPANFLRSSFGQDFIGNP